MKNVFLGEYVKQRRLDLGLTQEQLCYGICEPMTLSRLENGKQTPSRNRINALLQRLGLPDDRYFALLSKNELEMEALQKEIVACNVTEKVPEGFEKLAQFEKLADPDDQISQQLALRSRVLLGRLDGRYTPLEQIDLLMQAIQLTVPRFDLESIESFLYTRDEITIINQIGLAYSDAGQNKKAAEIYYQLLKYVRKHFKETITSIGVLPLVLYNYARVLDLCGRYEEEAALAKEGREACIQYGHYQVLPRCLEIEAECRHFMGVLSLQSHWISNRVRGCQKRSERILEHRFYELTHVSNARHSITWLDRRSVRILRLIRTVRLFRFGHTRLRRGQVFRLSGKAGDSQ